MNCKTVSLQFIVHRSGFIVSVWFDALGGRRLNCNVQPGTIVVPLKFFGFDLKRRGAARN
jgi:hypothetical protein